MKIIKVLLIYFGCLSLFGCLYRPDVQQGNVITNDMVSQLRPGMTMDQVHYVMGTPVLTNTFDPNRLDYVYTMRHGSEPRKQQHVTLIFNKGILQSIQEVPLTTVTKK